MMVNLIAVLSVLFLIGCEASYVWRTVYESDVYPSDTIYHSSKEQGSQTVCGVDGFASGRENGGTCIIPYNGYTLIWYKPFQILVRDPLSESMQWFITESVQQIRDNAVVVCKNCNKGEPEIYVCGIPDWGPGKLVIWADNDIACHISYNNKHYAYLSGYQVLLANPPSEYRLTNVHYDLNLLDVIREQPKYLAQATLVNRDLNEQLLTHAFSYSKGSQYEWEVAYTLALAINYSVSAGIPGLIGTEWSVGLEMVFNLLYGESYSESVDISLTAQVTVPPQHSCVVTIVATEMVVDVPYEATITAYHHDGTTTTSSVTGIYNGLSVSNDLVEVSECLPLSLDALNYNNNVNATSRADRIIYVNKK